MEFTQTILQTQNPHVIIGTNTYYLFGANNESSQDTLQGLTAAGAYLDEVALFPESFVTQALGRCSAQTGNQGAKVFVNCNPEGPYHWFKTDYIDQAKAKQIFVLHFTLEDNLSLAESVKQRYHRMFSGVFYQRYILGLWVMAEGVVYDIFDEEQHVIDDLPDTFERLFVGGDFGMNNPTAFLLLGQKGKNFYVIREYYHASGKQSETEQSQQKTLGQYTDDFIQFLGNDRPEVVYLDPSALALIRELRARGYTNIKAADNTVNEGIQLVQNLLSGHEGQLFIHRSCEHLIREFCSYGWDPKAQERGEDAVIKENDHALDALRYALFNMWHALRKTSARKERLRGGKGGTYL